MTDENAQIESRIAALLAAQETDAAWREIERLAERQHNDRQAAMALLGIVENHALAIESARSLLSRIYDAHQSDVEIIARIGECMERARDIDLLNAAPPDDGFFATLVYALTASAGEVSGGALEEIVLSGLATTARIMGRRGDNAAERSYKRLIELQPQAPWYRYGYGLFLKTRGRFAEGVAANQAAISLVEEPREACLWNLGICATGAGAADIALGVWKRIDQVIEIGRFDLPEGDYPNCKVRLAQRPLAERDAANDDPGLEETIWIERLSPCHGIVRSVLYQNLGVDYGDVVLFDGAPITHHRYGDRDIPVFPHLATLLRRDYQMFDFAGVQTEAGQLADLTRDLSDDAIVYAHTEQFHILCASCWRDPSIDHAHADTLTKHVVVGRIAAPQTARPANLLRDIDAALARRVGCDIYAPALAAAAGLEQRALEEALRFELLKHSGSSTH